MVADPNAVKVYTVNGVAAGSSSSLPDWLTRKRSAAKGKRAAKEQVEGALELIQGFEFPEASNRIKSTRDGHHVVATGVYKPQIRVWDLDQLSVKFERHSDAENVDFVLLSDDWTKSIHLQNDRTIEFHTQGGFHYRTRIPKFGRSLVYHYPSCDAYFTASGPEIYRLNLDQGRFMTPLSLQSDSGGEVVAVNTVDVNPVHQLLAFGVEGNGTVQFWDPRSRACVGVLRLPKSRLMPTGVSNSVSDSLSVTAISSRVDGLSYAIGTSTGHTLLYDIRSPTSFSLKDQGYGLPIKKVIWIEGGSRMAGDGMVLSADKKVIKIWDKDDPSSNFVSITPAQDLNDVHHIPASGLLMTANEGIQMATYYIPQLGPAPRWASFLENITEEMEDQTTRSVYEDYKFVERSELRTLGLDHLVGTPALRPYMHGYFISFKLYDAARIIANPFAYAEHQEKMVREKMEKMAETRIRAKKDAGVKVNKSLAEKILKEVERDQKKAEKKKRKQAENGENADEQQQEKDGDKSPQKTILNDPRFQAVFENPDYAIDENTREFALLNPSTAAQTKGMPVRKTAVEDEDEESDKISSDDLADSNESEGEKNEGSSSDSSDAGELNTFDPRSRPGQKNTRMELNYNRTSSFNRFPRVNLVPMQTASGPRALDKNATFGQRRQSTSALKGKKQGSETNTRLGEDGAMEMTWTPSASAVAAEDSIFNDSGEKRAAKKGRKGSEMFGAGMERGVVPQPELGEMERQGRTHRRKGMRSGSKNVFRSLK